MYAGGTLKEHIVATSFTFFVNVRNTSIVFQMLSHMCAQMN